MISSQEGTEDRLDRPPAAFLTGRSRAGGGDCAALSSSMAVSRPTEPCCGMSRLLARA